MPAVIQEGICSRRNQPDLFYRYLPGERRDACLVILHGFAEHSGRYLELMDVLKQTSLPILAGDLRGHGRSGGVRVHVDAWRDYWMDVQDLLAYVQERHGVPPQTLLIGHSLGGLIALDGALQEPAGLKGLILSSPCLGLRIPALLRGLNAILQSVMPQWYHPHPVNAGDLTHDPAVSAAYEQDEWVQKKISARLVFEMLQCMQRLEEGTLRLTVPVFFLAAAEEHVVDLGRTLVVYARLDAPLKRLRCFEGFRHEIFNELQKQIAYDAVLEAIRKILDFHTG